jgi:hypothetical protein
MPSTEPPRSPRTFHPSPRAPLRSRKRLERMAARRRVAAFVRKPLSVAQRANDPLIHRGRSLGAKLAKAVGALAGCSGSW